MNDVDESGGSCISGRVVERGCAKVIPSFVPRRLQEMLMLDSLGAESDGKRSARKRILPTVALSMTVAGLVASVLLAILVASGIIDAPWDAIVLPRVAFAGLLPFCVTSLLVSCVSRFQHRDPIVVQSLRWCWVASRSLLRWDY